MWLVGRDVVGVSRSSTGKTLAYLLPILSMIHDSSQYKELPEGIGVRQMGSDVVI